MWFGVVSLFPEMVDAVAAQGVLGRARANGIVDLTIVNPRTFTADRHNTVDDRPYGGGPGMVMMVEPLLAAVAEAQSEYRARTGAAAPAPVVYLSPRGRTLDQQLVCELAAEDGLVLLAGRYEGIDERVVDQAVDMELSIGDYVLSGGELPALVVLDAVARHLPGTLGNAASAQAESHLEGLLDYPHYTRPENTPAGLAGRDSSTTVPAVLLSGDHRAVSRWRLMRALKTTYDVRPDLLATRALSDIERELLAEALAADEPGA